MASLIIHDSFESYYVGRDTVVRRRPETPAQPPKAPRLGASARERMLPVRLSDIRAIRAVKPS